jgi:hypothetical protein
LIFGRKAAEAGRRGIGFEPQMMIKRQEESSRVSWCAVSDE